MSSISSSKDFRKSTFKNKGLSSEEIRRRREETIVEIRKQKKEGVLSKHRNVSQIEEDFEEDAPDENLSISNTPVCFLF